MRRLVVLLGLLGALLVPSSAQASFPDPWGDLQISGTSFGTNCHLNRCQGNGQFGVTMVANSASFWSVAKCAVSIGAFIAGNGFLIAKARKAGGVFKTAKRIWKAKGKVKKWKTARDTFGYVLGLTAVIDGCGG